MRATTPQTSHDCDHDDNNSSNHNCVSCGSYHLRAVILTMSKSVVVTMIPMMGGTTTTTSNAHIFFYLRMIRQLKVPIIATHPQVGRCLN
jgi:hypothetical protein